MVLELVGSRVLAPYFGATTIIWTALIGIIMASLALGYWWGGRFADRHPDYRVLTVVFMIAGISIAAIAFGKEVVLGFLSARTTDIRLGASLAAIALFSLPSFLLSSTHRSRPSGRTDPTQAGSAPRSSITRWAAGCTSAATRGSRR